MNRAPDDRLREIARRKGVAAAGRHIFLCCDQTTPNCCDREASLAAWGYLKSRLRELGLSEQGGVYRTKANCLRIIEEHLIGGRIVEEHLILQHSLTE